MATILIAVWRNARRGPQRAVPLIKPIRFDSVVVWKTGMLGDVEVGILLLQPFFGPDSSGWHLGKDEELTRRLSHQELALIE